MTEGSDSMTGYLHADYAQSLAEFGVPRELPRSRGWILVRQIPGFDCNDGMGSYPVFACRNWSKLHVDLEELGTELVSLAVVSDPFGDYAQSYLENCFKDVFFPFKDHFVTDLRQPLGSFVAEHHRRYARRSLKSITVERCERPSDLLDEWVALYSNLVRRHSIRGIARFSREAFAKQLAVPGLVVFRALCDGSTVGVVLWYVQGEVGYYHLAAYSERGYELRASFGLFWTAMEYFASQGLRWLNLGGGAGFNEDSQDGLSRFKRGWATDRRPVYFCGRIFRRDMYSKILEAKGIKQTDYFPAYRVGEFS